MNAKDLAGPGGLALVPLEGETPVGPVTGKAKFTANTREGRDRRATGERREQLRMTEDRRAGKDRRPRTGWERGKNL